MAAGSEPSTTPLPLRLVRTASRAGTGRAVWIALQRIAADSRGLRLLLLLSGMLLGFLLLIIVAHISGSLALGSLAHIVLYDMLVLASSALAIWVAQQRPDATDSYGLERLEVLAVFTNAIVVFCSALYVTKEAIERLLEPHPIHRYGAGRRSWRRMMRFLICGCCCGCRSVADGDDGAAPIECLPRGAESILLAVPCRPCCYNWAAWPLHSGTRRDMRPPVRASHVPASSKARLTLLANSAVGPVAEACIERLQPMALRRDAVSPCATRMPTHARACIRRCGIVHRRVLHERRADV